MQDSGVIAHLTEKAGASVENKYLKGNKNGNRLKKPD
jgi:hypothetical protein